MTITDRGRRRIAVGSGVVGVALLAATSPFWATHLGRQISWLEVDKVEIAGTRLLAPHEVLAASGIRDGQHLLDERSVWEASLLENPVIASASITRKLPNTLRVTVQEKVPVAFVEGETLRLVTSTGEILPLDPATLQVDLPIVHGSLSDSTRSAATHRLLLETERLTQLDPALMAEVSEIRSTTEDGSTLMLVLPGAQVLLHAGATAARTAQIRAVLADVTRRIQPQAGQGSTAAARVRLDLRFGDQIVVAPLSSAGIS